MMQVLVATPMHGLEAVLVAMELVFESGRLSADHVLNILARLKSPSGRPGDVVCMALTLDVDCARRRAKSYAVPKLLYLRPNIVPRHRPVGAGPFSEGFPRKLRVA